MEARFYKLWRNCVFFLLGIASGMPLALTGSTFSMRLIDLGIDKSTIGVLGVIGFVYSIKFLYAPLLDYFQVPVLNKIFGKRRDWMVLSGVFCALGMILTSNVSANHQLGLICLATFIIAFSSTVFDISCDAMRIESVDKQDQGLVSAIFIYGYRVGMLLSGGFALFLAQKFDWSLTYIIVACVYLSSVFLGIFASFLILKKFHRRDVNTAAFLKIKMVAIDPFLDLLTKPYAKLFLLTISIFKLTDVYVGQMTNPFLVELGFSKAEIAAVVKGIGFFATLFGVGAGGFLTSRISAGKVVMFALVMQILVNQLFLVQYHFGHNIPCLTVVICLENFFSSMSNMVLVFIISRACNIQFSGTQYAVMSSFASLSRTLIGSGSGYLASAVGWKFFFLLAGALEIPCLLLCWFLSRKKVF